MRHTYDARTRMHPSRACIPPAMRRVQKMVPRPHRFDRRSDREPANPILEEEGANACHHAAAALREHCAADLELSSLISLLLFRSVCLLLLPGSHLPCSSSTCARWLNSGQQIRAIRRRASKCSPSWPSITSRCDGTSSRCGAVFYSVDSTNPHM